MRLIALAPLAAGATMSPAATSELEKVVNSTNLTDAEKEKLLKVAATLWTYFLIGSKHATIGEGCTERARLLSGDYIIKNLKDFDDLTGGHDQTQFCCGLCGYKAKELAKGGVITPDIFEAAWKETQMETKALLERAREIYKKEPDPSQRALGCG